MAKDLFAPPTEEELTEVRAAKLVEADDLFAPPTEEERKAVSQPPDTVAGARPEKVPGKTGADSDGWDKLAGMLGTLAGGVAGPAGSVVGRNLMSDKGTEVKEFTEGAEQGIKEVIDPDAVTKEELTEPQTWSKLAGNILGSMGADITGSTLSAKAGGAAGSFVPVAGTAVGSIAGLVGWGAFSAYNQEKLAERRTGEFKQGRLAARMALSVNPVLRYGGRISEALMRHAPKVGKVLQATEKVGARATRLVGQVAGETAVAADEFGPQGAIMAAATSLGLHGMMFKAGRDITPVASKVMGNVAAGAGAEVAPKAAKRLANIPEKALEYRDERLTSDLARFITRSQKGGRTRKSPELIAAARKEMALLDEAAQNNIYRDYVATKIMSSELSKYRVEAMNEFVRKSSYKGELADLEDYHKYWKDGLVVAEEMDRVAGTGTVGTINQLAESRGIYENVSAELYRKAQVAQKIQKRAKISDNQMGQLREYLGTGDEKHLKDIGTLLDQSGQPQGKVKEAVDAWSDFFEEGRKSIQSMGFDIKARDYYVPTRMISGNDKLMAVDSYVRNVTDLAGVVGKENLAAWKVADLTAAGLSEPAAKNVLEQIRSLRYINRANGGGKKLRLADATRLKDKLLGTKNTHQMGRDVTAVLAKADDFDMPDSLRNYNISELAVNYVEGSVKAAVMSPAMRQAYNQMETFRIAQMPETAKWWANLMSDLNGDVRGKVRGEMQQRSNQLEYKIHKALNDDASSTAEFLGWGAANVGMKAFRYWQNSIYPAFLGMNTKATVRNMFQTYVQTAPYLGGNYGREVVTRSMFNGMWKHKDQLKKSGILAKGVTAEAVLSNTSKTSKAWRKFGDAALYTYQLSDDVNRIWSYNVGQTMARDLAKGRRDALEALEKMGAGVRTQLKKRGLDNLEAWRTRTDELGDVLGKHTVARTQFHYGPEQKAEFLREAGPFFSMFTKWPVSIGSDMNLLWRESPEMMTRAKRLFERYGSPLAAFWLVHSAMGDDNELYNFAIGDVRSVAPLMSVKDMSILNNPAIQTVMASPKFVDALIKVQDDPEKVEQMLREALQQTMKSAGSGASAILNEADRIKRAQNKKTVSSEIIKDLTK